MQRTAISLRTCTCSSRAPLQLFGAPATGPGASTWASTSTISSATPASRARRYSSAPSHGRSDSEAASTRATASSQERPTLSASEFLLQQARLEEEEELSQPKKIPIIPELREKAWDGDEPQERAIRRILADTYKPLRIKGHKKAIPQPARLENRLFDDQTIRTDAAVAEEDGTQITNPWHVTFKAPDSYKPPVVTPRGAAPRSRLANKVTPTARLAAAREKSWDHQAGFSAITGKPQVMVPEEDDGEEHGSMGGLRNFAGFVEDRILRAQKRGLFDKIEGRGKPIPKDEAEKNPFIPRDEFLINRIIKSQDCAPPWVELQSQLQVEQNVFRTTLGQSWIRRATRMLSVEGVTLSSVRDAQSYRDPEWEARERSFHEAAVSGLNQIVRKFNIIAPYSVRRPLIFLHLELDRCYRLAGPVIEAELQRRLDGSDEDRLPIRDLPKRDIHGRVADEEHKEEKETMWRAFKRVVVEVLAKGPDEVPPRAQREGAKA